MTDETLTDIAELDLPFRRRAILREVAFESGMRMIRLVLFEGKRVTQIDLDADAARQLGTHLLSGADSIADSVPTDPQP
ncbi:MAG: hypothetical protein ACI8R4_002475 [Paracoccaceae bacterium]|jgi:hypothetical protein